MKFIIKAILTVVYIVLATTVTVLAGCQAVTPTKVPPLSDELGYKVPNYKGWTTTGINDAVYKLETQKLEVLGKMVKMVNEPAYVARDAAIDWLNIALSGGLFGGLPLALRKLPKGAVRKEEHEIQVMKAGIQDPDEFKRSMDETGK